MPIERLWQAENVIQLAIDYRRKGVTRELEALRWEALKASDADLQAMLEHVHERDELERERRRDEATKNHKVQAIARGVGGWTLQREWVYCGKPNCAKKHGPYWYGYRSDAGRTRKHYFGADKPTAAEQMEALGKSRASSPAATLPKKKRATAVARSGLAGSRR